MLELTFDILTVTLPEGKSQEELIHKCKEEIKGIIATGATFGKDVKITGRITTGMALALGHELCHVCKSLSIFVPQENKYTTCIRH